MLHIEETRVSFRNDRTPVSERYDDIYFNPEDGIAESVAVYLEGAGVRASIDRGDSVIRVGELGFGVGINFLMTWDYFLKHSLPHQRLHYTSIEGFPVHLDDLKSLYKSYPEYGNLTSELLQHYPFPIPGLHRRSLSDHRVTLLLVWGTLPKALTHLEGKIGHWYWDGFSPKNNPDAFSTEVFQEVARLSDQGATGSSFTCAGWVRRAISESGFQVTKVPGFGRKRERLLGVFPGEASMNESPPKSIAILGAGLAGAFAARVFAEVGINAVVYEKDKPASKASGNECGLYNLQISAVPSPVSRVHLNALLLSRASQETNDWMKESLIQRGILKLLTTDEERTRAKRALDSHELPLFFAKILDQEEAQCVARVKLASPALHLPECGTLSPKLLVNHALQHQRITVISSAETPIATPTCPVILATGAEFAAVSPISDLPLQILPGQINTIWPNIHTQSLTCTLIDDGYTTPVLPSGNHFTGATYRTKPAKADQNELDQEVLLKATHRRSEAFLSWDSTSVAGIRVSNRLASPDKTPLIGLWGENTYLSLAHGSRGITTALLAAYFLLDQFRGDPLPMDRDLLPHLDPHRFDRRLRMASLNRSLSLGPKNSKNPE